MGEELDKARQALPRVQAHEALRHAIEGGKVDVIRPAITHARSAGVDLHELSAAERRIKQIEAQAEARNRLSKIVCSSDPKELKAAIEMAQYAGLEGPEVTAVERIYERLVVEETLEHAIREQRKSGLEDAISI